MLERLCERLNAAAELIVACLVTVTVIAVTAQVIFRYGVQSSLTWSEELSRYSFIWAIFIGTPIAARRGQHLAVTAIIGLLPERAQLWLRRANLALSAAFFALFLWTSVLLAQNALPQRSSALEISIAWVYASAVIGAALTLLQLLNALLQPRAGK